MNHNRFLWVTLSFFIVLALACNLLGQVAENVGDKIEGRIENQPQEALEATGNEELTEDLKGIAEEFTGQDLGELWHPA